MAKKSREPSLFTEFVEQVVFEYPVCIEYTGGERYGNGDVEAFYENGVRCCISTRGNASNFLKTKFRPKNSLTLEEGILEYELQIKTLLYIHKKITPDDFNKRYEEMDRINNELDLLTFEDTFKEVYYTEVNGIEKHSKPKTDEEAVIKPEEPAAEADHPF